MTDTGGVTYVSGVQYGPANELLQITYGAVSETRTYNSLLQLTSIYTGNVNAQYTYTAGQNNGRMASATVSGEQVVYTYDSLNRLILAETTGPTWGQAFVYDGFGNLLQKNTTKGSPPGMNYTVDATTNRLQGLNYDANGNMLNPPNAGTLTYDFLNRVATAPGGVAYSYDGSNRRVWKGTASTEAYYLYGIDGENLGTYTPQLQGSPPQLVITLASGQERNYFFGKKLFTTEDNVGSAVRTGSSSRTFYPYGEQKSGTVATEQYAFATYWRDGETAGLDYAMNRYYSSTLGRFLSADPYADSMNAGNPQSFNLYEYVGNDPANRNDASGLCDAMIGGIAQNSVNGADFENFASGDNAISVYPFSSHSNTSSALSHLGSILYGIGQVALQAYGANSSTYAAVVGLMLASQAGLPMNVTAYSGGAGTLTAAVTFLNAQGAAGQSVVGLINHITYVAPGSNGPLYNNGNVSVIGGGFINALVGVNTSIPQDPAPPTIYTDQNHCGHSFGCLADEFPEAFVSGTACPDPVIVNQDLSIRSRAPLFGPVDPFYWQNLILDQWMRMMNPAVPPSPTLPSVHLGF
jgi:RHS repeat-associated protein